VDVNATFTGRRCLITGGLGFIGSNLAHRLVGLEASVRVVDSMAPGMGGNPHNLDGIRGAVDVEIMDIGDTAADRLDDAIADSDYLFNLAGQVSHVDSVEQPEQDLYANATAHLRLLERCRRVNPGVRIVYASTRQVYGRPLRTPVDEDHPAEPVDFNGVHKWAGERFHALFHQVFDLDTVILRLTNTYGPRQLMHHGRQGFIPAMVRRAMDGDALEVYGDGSQQRDFCEVQDSVEAFLAALAIPDTRGRVFNVCGAETTTLKRFTEVLLDVVGEGSYTMVPFPPDRQRIDVGSVTVDWRRFHDAVGWRPRVRLREGLERMVGFYRAERDRYWSAP
jgi:UDP-glucose 4-epimerase